MLLFFAVNLTGFGRVEAQDWFQASSPDARCCPSMVFDWTHYSTVLFGGNDVSGNLADTWKLGEGGWFQLTPATSPPARSAAGMAFDAATGTVVLFGGSNGTDLNDTWIWDGTTWAQVLTSKAPSGRRWDTQGMAYDAATGNVVLFGGVTSDGTMLGDTWTWNGKTRTWTEQHPAVSPSPRRAPIAYDWATGTVVLFGGEGSYGGPTFGDTWVWNGTNWRQLFPATSPPARSMASMAYDFSLRRLVLFGGCGAGSSAPFYNDTWTWNGTTWTQVSTAAAPPERYAFGMDYDPITQGEVIFGGLFFFDTVRRGDTWKLAMKP